VSRASGRAPLSSRLVLALAAIMWLAPLAVVLYASVAPGEAGLRSAYVSFPPKLTLESYLDAWRGSNLAGLFVNTAVITFSSLVLVLFLGSFTAFAITQVRFRGRVPLLLLLATGSLLPYPVLIVPLFHLYTRVPLPGLLSDSGTLYNSYPGVIAIDTACTSGFIVLALANFMRAAPHEITEAAIMDGASLWRQYRSIWLPMCRPAFITLTPLLLVWIYNDFLFGFALISETAKRPVTSALFDLRAQWFFTNYDLLAAGTVMIMVPTALVFILMQRQYVAALTLGTRTD
jgi:multiple sugar transport system permease protein